MTIVIFSAFIVYFVLLQILLVGWNKAIDSQPLIPTVNLPFISVLVPVRNEEGNMNQLLDDLLIQNYPNHLYEIIVINDHSEDKTQLIVEDHLRASNFSNGVIVQSEGRGKKAAITQGVSIAKGSIVVTTDADCRVKNNWLYSISTCFNEEKVQLVFGAVKITAGKTIFENMQAIEFASLVGSGAATMSWGAPTMCNGANLAFRKNIFIELGGYEGNLHVASGDDEFLMRKIFSKHSDGIRFNSLEDSMVSTGPQNTIREFFMQRIRWAGKWRFHNDLKTKTLAIAVLSFHLLILLLPVFIFLGYLSVAWGLIFFLSKALMEYLFLRRVTAWMQVKWCWPAFILLQSTYSLYAVWVGLLSNFVKPVWKGRTK